MRIADLHTTRQVELEERLEGLRDRRWARRRSMISVVGRWALVGAVALAIDFHLTPDLLIRAATLI